VDQKAQKEAESELIMSFRFVFFSCVPVAGVVYFLMTYYIYSRSVFNLGGTICHINGGKQLFHCNVMYHIRKHRLKSRSVLSG